MFFLVVLFGFMFFTLQWGYVFMDAENWIPANSLVTPNHIQPEWYFLFAYAILRSIPNKLGGVVGLLISVSILFIFRVSRSSLSFGGGIYSPVSRLLFWLLVSVFFFLLTWLGSCPAESPYVEVALSCTIFYFVIFFFILYLSIN